MYDDLIAAASAKWGVPQSWIGGVIQRESSFNANAYNPNDPGGARGLMQIIAATAHAYGVTDLSTLFDPAVNIDVGTHLLSDLRVNYGDDFQRVYSAYNSGKPDAYLTSSEVATNVAAAVSDVTQWAMDHPEAAIAGGAAGGVLLFLVGYWFLKFKKGKK